MRKFLYITLATTLLLGVFVIAKGADQEPPETITINKLKNLYSEVEFPHSDHFDYADDCSTCHHHSDEPVSCVKCHKPIKVYRYEGIKRKTGLGLKGAYHKRCIGCHKESSGPVGCTDCHDRVKKPVPNY